MSTLLQLCDELIDAAKALSISATDPSWMYNDHNSQAYFQAWDQIRDYYRRRKGDTVSVPCQILRVFLDMELVLQRILADEQQQQQHFFAQEYLLGIQFCLRDLIAEGYRQIQLEIAKEMWNWQFDDEPTEQEINEAFDRRKAHLDKMNALAETIQALIREYGVEYVLVFITARVEEDIFVAAEQVSFDPPDSHGVLRMSRNDLWIDLTQSMPAPLPIMQRDRPDPQVTAEAKQHDRAASSERAPLDEASVAEIVERVRAALHNHEIPPLFVHIRIVAEESYFDRMSKYYPAEIDKTTHIDFSGKDWAFIIQRYRFPPW